jgi:hypothetical protein
MPKRKSSKIFDISKNAALAGGVSIIIGLIALWLSFNYYEAVNPVIQNVLDWFVGIGFVGGVIGLVISFASSLMKGKRVRL